MKKYILALFLLMLIFLALFPYFTSSFLDLRQKKENEENHQRFLKEKLAKKKAEKEAKEKIYLTGKFDPAQREDFTFVPKEYSLGANRMYLRKETLDAFLKMRDAANKNGVDLKIASATRNFDYQKELWEKKWNGVTLVESKDLSKSIPDKSERVKKILEYSAVPGTSRHHWGTDIDINGAEPAYFNSSKGMKEYDWLVQNAHIFGFCQTYDLKGNLRSTGHNEEKWHWSYLPLAQKLTQEYKNLVTNEDIKGFPGDEYVSSLGLMDNYILAINPDCA